MYIFVEFADLKASSFFEIFLVFVRLKLVGVPA